MEKAPLHRCAERYLSLHATQKCATLSRPRFQCMKFHWYLKPKMVTSPSTISRSKSIDSEYELALVEWCKDATEERAQMNDWALALTLIPAERPTVIRRMGPRPLDNLDLSGHPHSYCPRSKWLDFDYGHSTIRVRPGCLSFDKET